MTNKKTIWIMMTALALLAGGVQAQERAIQPSPAYYQHGGTAYAPAAPAAQPVVQPVAQPVVQPVAQPAVQPVEQPVMVVPAVQVVPEAAQPVYHAAPAAQPVPAQPKLTLAPASAEDEEGEAEYETADEEGIYWFWGQKWPGLSLGPKIGTTGIGLDLTFGINPYVNLRGGFNYGTFTWNADLGDEKYDMDIDMTSVPLLVDIHPFAGNFHLTAGLYIQPDSKADIETTPTDNTQVGEHTYAPDVIGTLYGNVEVANTVAPYVGFGFGNTVGEDQLLTFHLDIGVIIQSYDSSLTSDGAGMTAKLDTFREDVKKEEQNIQDDLDSFPVYPVITLGLAWHF